MYQISGGSMCGGLGRLISSKKSFIFEHLLLLGVRRRPAKLVLEKLSFASQLLLSIVFVNPREQLCASIMYGYRLCSVLFLRKPFWSLGMFRLPYLSIQSSVKVLCLFL